MFSPSKYFFKIGESTDCKNKNKNKNKNEEKSSLLYGTHGMKHYWQHWSERIWDCSIYGLLTLIEYLIMLSLMTYNAWIFIIVIIGLMISRFIFYKELRHLEAQSNTCHPFD